MSVKIFVADDSEIIRGILRALVEANSEWEICGEADNGQSAVTKVRELKPDLVILDFDMPLMDGLAAGRLISEALPGTPIILHTLHSTADLEIEAIKSGIRRVVLKSEGADLVPVMREILMMNNATATIAPFTATDCNNKATREERR